MNRTLFAPILLLCFAACSDDTTSSVTDSTTSDAAAQDGGNTTENDGSTTSEDGSTILPSGGSGALDATFKNPDGVVNTLALKADGKIFIAGSSSSYAGADRSKIALLNADGTVDPGFVPVPAETNNGISATALLPDGKIVIGGNFNSTGLVRIGRLGTDGKRDTTFNVGGKGAEGSVSALLRQSDGKIIVSGYLTKYNDTPCSRVTRINEDGTIDATFAPGQGAGPGVGPIIRALALQSDGKIIVAGGFETFDGKARKNIARLNANGSLDESFNAGDTGDVNAVAVQADGKILVAGAFTKWNGLTANGNYLVRLNTDGTLDATYKSPFVLEDGVLAGLVALALQSDGKVIAGGRFSNVNLPSHLNLARFNTDGSVDPSYTPAEAELKKISITSLLLQPDGKLLIGADGGVIRLN